MSFHRTVSVAVLDVLIIIELAISIYVANLDPESFTPVFFKYFFAMLVPTLISAKILLRRFRTAEAEPAR